MSSRTLIIKVFVFIFIKPPLHKRFGGHSTTDIPYKYYIGDIHIKQLKSNSLIYERLYIKNELLRQKKMILKSSLFEYVEYSPT